MKYLILLAFFATQTNAASVEERLRTLEKQSKAFASTAKKVFHMQKQLDSMKAFEKVGNSYVLETDKAKIEIKYDGEIVISSHEDVRVTNTAGGELILHNNGHVYLRSDRNLNFRSQMSLNLEANTNMSLSSNTSTSIESAANMSIKSDTLMSIKADNQLKLNGGTLILNNGTRPAVGHTDPTIRGDTVIGTSTTIFVP